MDSILTSVKKMNGVAENNVDFDTDLIMHTNTVLLIINQLGIGPDSGFLITGKDETWAQLLGDRKDIEAVKNLISMKVKLLFDPPQNSNVLESYKNNIEELEWRLNAQVNKPVIVPDTTPTEEGGI